MSLGRGQAEEGESDHQDLCRQEKIGSKNSVYKPTASSQWWRDCTRNCTEHRLWAAFLFLGSDGDTVDLEVMTFVLPTAHQLQVNFMWPAQHQCAQSHSCFNETSVVQRLQARPIYYSNSKVKKEIYSVSITRLMSQAKKICHASTQLIHRGDTAVKAQLSPKQRTVLMLVH